MAGPAAAAKPARAWQELTARQRDLLRRAYNADQAAEQSEKQRARDAQDDFKALYPRTRPAADWRWISLDQARGRLRPRDSDEADYRQLERVGLLELNAGTLKMTRAGRAVVRARTGAPAPDRAPRGLLSQWSWAALAELYAAGTGGLVLWHSTRRVKLAGWEQCPSWGTVVRLRNRREPYVEEFQTEADGWCVRLTAAGRAHVDEHRDRYAGHYPDVRIPGPDHAVTRHRGDQDQMARDIRHRAEFFGLAEAAAAARAAGDLDEAARIDAQADAYRRQPSLCGHWPSGLYGTSCAARPGIVP